MTLLLGLGPWAALWVGYSGERIEAIQWIEDRDRGGWDMFPAFGLQGRTSQLCLKAFMPLWGFNIMLFLSLLSSAQAMVSVSRARFHPCKSPNLNLPGHIPTILAAQADIMTSVCLVSTALGKPCASQRLPLKPGLGRFMGLSSRVS